MPYQSLKNEEKISIDMPDAAFQCPSSCQLVELNHTRRILVVLTGIQFVLSLFIIVGVICAYLFGYTLNLEWSHPMVQLLPILSCTCFLLGSLAADRCHVKGLLLFSKLVLLDLIVTYLIVTIYIVIPIGLKKYPTNLTAKIIVGLSYQIIFCIVSLVPAYTSRMADRLSKLLIDNNYSPIK